MLVHADRITDHALRTTCWTLAEGAAASKLAVTLKNPDGRSVAFLGGLALLLERRAGEDAVSVWHASTWVLASRWRTGVHSAEEVVCIASGEVLLWDLDAVCLHSVNGTLLAHFHGEALRACVASPKPGGMIACLTHDFALLVLAANTLECVAGECICSLHALPAEAGFDGVFHPQCCRQPPHCGGRPARWCTARRGWRRRRLRDRSTLSCPGLQCPPFRSALSSPRAAEA